MQAMANQKIEVSSHTVSEDVHSSIQSCLDAHVNKTSIKPQYINKHFFSLLLKHKLWPLSFISGVGRKIDLGPK